MQFDVLELRVVAVFFAPLANQLARGGFSIRAPFVPAPPTTENFLLRFGRAFLSPAAIRSDLAFRELLFGRASYSPAAIRSALASVVRDSLATTFPTLLLKFRHLNIVGDKRASLLQSVNLMNQITLF